MRLRGRVYRTISKHIFDVHILSEGVNNVRKEFSDANAARPSGESSLKMGGDVSGLASELD